MVDRPPNVGAAVVAVVELDVGRPEVIPVPVFAGELNEKVGLTSALAVPV